MKDIEDLKESLQDIIHQLLNDKCSVSWFQDAFNWIYLKNLPWEFLSDEEWDFYSCIDQGLKRTVSSLMQPQEFIELLRNEHQQYQARAAKRT